MTEQTRSVEAVNAALVSALVEAKRAMWIEARHQWTMADFKNWAVIQQIDAALSDARTQASGIPA